MHFASFTASMTGLHLTKICSNLGLSLGKAFHVITLHCHQAQCLSCHVFNHQKGLRSFWKIPLPSQGIYMCLWEKKGNPSRITERFGLERTCSIRENPGIDCRNNLKSQGLNPTQVISHPHYVFYWGEQVSLLYTAIQSLTGTEALPS